MGPRTIQQLRPARGAAGRRRVALGTLAAMAAALLPQQALAGDTATANTTAVVLNPGSIVKMNDMLFGSIAVAGSAGTTVIPPQAAATCTTTGGLVHSGSC